MKRLFSRLEDIPKTISRELGGIGMFEEAVEPSGRVAWRNKKTAFPRRWRIDPPRVDRSLGMNGLRQLEDLREEDPRRLTRGPWNPGALQQA